MNVSDRLFQTPFIAVLDSQAVLDWLYFADPLCGRWQDQLEQGQWQWWIGASMRDELAHVLGRGHLPSPRGLDGAGVLARVDALAQCHPAPAALAHGPLRCTDRDDQKFIDFATHHRARWLVSRDRAVLKLRRRATALHGVEILAPADWTRQLDAGPQAPPSGG